MDSDGGASSGWGLLRASLGELIGSPAPDAPAPASGYRRRRQRSDSCSDSGSDTPAPTPVQGVAPGTAGAAGGASSNAGAPASAVEEASLFRRISNLLSSAPEATPAARFAHAAAAEAGERLPAAAAAAMAAQRRQRTKRTDLRQQLHSALEGGSVDSLCAANSGLRHRLVGDGHAYVRGEHSETDAEEMDASSSSAPLLDGGGAPAVAWEEPEGGGAFRVRGASYLDDRAKVSVLHARGELLYVDVVDSTAVRAEWDGSPLRPDEGDLAAAAQRRQNLPSAAAASAAARVGRLDHACAEPGGIAQYCKRRWGSLPPRKLFLFVVNFQLPLAEPEGIAGCGARRYSVVAYFGLPPLTVLLAEESGVLRAAPPAAAGAGEASGASGAGRGTGSAGGDAARDGFTRLLAEFLSGGVDVEDEAAAAEAAAHAAAASDGIALSAAEAATTREAARRDARAAADTRRAERFKVLPRLAEGNWALRKIVGEKPCVLGRSTDMGLRYFTDGSGADWASYSYFEVCVDTAASTVASAIIAQLLGSAGDLVGELGVLLEAASAVELPEQLLGCARLEGLDFARARRVVLDSAIGMSSPETRPSDTDSRGDDALLLSPVMTGIQSLMGGRGSTSDEGGGGSLSSPGPSRSLRSESADGAGGGQASTDGGEHASGYHADGHYPSSDNLDGGEEGGFFRRISQWMSPEEKQRTLRGAEELTEEEEDEATAAVAARQQKLQAHAQAQAQQQRRQQQPRKSKGGWFGSDGEDEAPAPGPAGTRAGYEGEDEGNISWLDSLNKLRGGSAGATHAEDSGGDGGCGGQGGRGDHGGRESGSASSEAGPPGPYWVHKVRDALMGGRAKDMEERMVAALEAEADIEFAERQIASRSGAMQQRGMGGSGDAAGGNDDGAAAVTRHEEGMSSRSGDPTESTEAARPAFRAALRAAVRAGEVPCMGRGRGAASIDGMWSEPAAACGREGAEEGEEEATRTPSPLLLRGPNYFADRSKVPAARGARGELLWVDLVETDQRMDHVCSGQNSVASFCEQWARSMFLFVLNFQVRCGCGSGGALQLRTMAARCAAQAFLAVDMLLTHTHSLLFASSHCCSPALHIDQPPPACCIHFFLPF